MGIRHERGRSAEALAAAYLRLLGFRIRAANERMGGVEIDLIAEDGETTVLVEVKLRSRNDFGGAAQAVDRGKLARLARASLALQSGMRGAVRVDVVTVDLDGDEARLRLIRNIRFDA
jgi:putative endonuclease